MSQINLPAYILNLLGFTSSSKHSSKKRSDCEDSEPADLSNMVRKLVLDNHRRVETARAGAEKQPSKVKVVVVVVWEDYRDSPT